MSVIIVSKKVIVNCNKNKESITLLKKILSKSYDIEEEKEERKFWKELIQL